MAFAGICHVLCWGSSIFQYFNGMVHLVQDSEQPLHSMFGGSPCHGTNHRMNLFCGCGIAAMLDAAYHCIDFR